jgi:hypothetical protein
MGMTALILEPVVSRKILRHLGQEEDRPPPADPSRASEFEEMTNRLESKKR